MQSVEAGKRTWTAHVFTCIGCHQQVYASAEAIEASREGVEDKRTDAEIAASFDYCLSCLDDVDAPGEKVQPDANWTIAHLTPRDIFAIHAALVVACDDEEEPFPGLRDALTKVDPIVTQLRASGHEQVPKTVSDDNNDFQAVMLGTVAAAADAQDCVAAYLVGEGREQKRGAPYERPIRETLAKLGLIGRYDPRHIEAYMRVEHSTLDGLSEEQFRTEVSIAVGAIDMAGTADAEALAKTYGF